MKNAILVVVIVMSAAVFGCSSRWGSAGLGAVGGAAAGAGGYEYQANREMKQIEEDYKAGRIDKREYEIRKDQIQRGSILK